jgi:hypothetical protein
VYPNLVFGVTDDAVTNALGSLVSG